MDCHFLKPFLKYYSRFDTIATNNENIGIPVSEGPLEE
jgi:hypothetical protein